MTTSPRIPVSSSQIESVRHDSDKREMTVWFHNGSCYRYQNVTTEDFNFLLTAPSVGAHFSKVFKGNPQKHPYQKVQE